MVAWRVLGAAALTSLLLVGCGAPAQMGSAPAESSVDTQPVVDGDATISSLLDVVALKAAPSSEWVQVGSMAFAAQAFVQADADGGVLYSVQIGETRAAPAFVSMDLKSAPAGYFLENNMGLVPAEIARDPFAHECFARVDSGDMTKSNATAECLEVFVAAGYDLLQGRFPSSGVAPSD